MSVLIYNSIDIKGPVCNNYGDLLTEMEYNTYNFVVSAIQSPYETSRYIFITLDLAFLFTFTVVRSTHKTYPEGPQTL